LHRVHEKPDAKKVLEFEELARAFGYSLGVEICTSARLRFGMGSCRRLQSADGLIRTVTGGNAICA